MINRYEEYSVERSATTLDSKQGVAVAIVICESSTEVRLHRVETSAEETSITLRLRKEARSKNN